MSEARQTMNLETWQRAAELDGASIWDVYVLHTNRSEWQRLLDWLRGSGLPLTFSGPTPTDALPRDVGEIFAWHADWICTLSIDPNGMHVNTHFFVEHEIEFNIGPRDFQSERELARLREFLTGIARLLDKTVFVSPENLQEHPLFEIRPDGSTRSCFE